MDLQNLLFQDERLKEGLFVCVCIVQGLSGDDGGQAVHTERSAGVVALTLNTHPHTISFPKPRRGYC